MNLNSVFLTQKPKSKFLQQYIAYYYFHKSTDKAVLQKIFCYPHVKNALTIYKNADVLLNKDPFLSFVTPNTNNNYTYLYTTTQKQCYQVAIHPPFEKLGIVFQPLGINHFIKENLTELMDSSCQLHFHSFKSTMETTLEHCFQKTELSEKVTLLDDFFKANYIGFFDKEIDLAVELILHSKTKFTVQSLSQKLNISRRTLLRKFKKHLNISTKEYINVVQFRKALESYQQAFQKPSLTHLAYDTNYYDQSEFINHFKKITGFNPKKFFKDITHLGSEDTFWTWEK